MIKLRWLQEHYEATRADIQEYQTYRGCGFVEAKMTLQPTLLPTLQYFDEATQSWEDVPTEVVSLGKYDWEGNE